MVIVCCFIVQMMLYQSLPLIGSIFVMIWIFKEQLVNMLVDFDFAVDSCSWLYGK